MKIQNLFSILAFTTLVPFVSGCVHLPVVTKTAVGPKARLLNAKGPVQIAFKPKLNHVDVTDYHSQSVTSAYSGDSLVKTLTDIVDFTVKTKTVAVDSEGQTATYDMKTIKKTGLTDLSDFAMPDLGQTLELMMTNQGKVLKAGDYPPGTLFFVPPVSLPEKPVKVGDSWKMTSEWVSLKSGLPLKMKTVSTLEAIRKCGSTGRCAEIDLTGNVTLENKKTDQKSPKFDSLMHGSLLFSLDRGTVLYSYLKSTESLSGHDMRIEIHSCMVTNVIKPTDENLLGTSALNCDPLARPPKY